jgi:hypothetical protein
MAGVAAEQIIALEAAVADIGSLYVVARGYAALRERAETELLPQVAALSSRLRRLVRQARLGDDELDAAAREIVAVGFTWRAALEELRTSAIYRRALAAFAADRQDDLSDLLPRVFAGLHSEAPPPHLCFPFSPSSRRRRPGHSPFVDPIECADTLTALLRDGIEPAAEGTEWWDRDLPSIDCTDASAALETPIWLQAKGSDLSVAVFRVESSPSLRLFTARLRAPMQAGLAQEASDEWWQAYEESYSTYRQVLRKELLARGVALVE